MEEAQAQYLWFLVVLVWQSLYANAQWNSLNPPYEGEDSKVTWSVSLSCVLAGIVVFVLFQLHGCCFTQSQSQSQSQSQFQSHHRKPLASTTEAIEKCPILDYSTVKELKVGNEAEECAVCLVEFQDSHTIKMLPKCQHIFHQHCIDKWLPSCMTCPICRQKLISYDAVVVDMDVPTEQQEHATESTESQVAVTSTDQQPQPESQQHQQTETETETDTDTDTVTVVGHVQVHFEVA